MRYVIEQCVSMNIYVVVEANDRNDAFEKAKEYIDDNNSSGEELFFEDVLNAFIEETDDAISR